MDEREALIDRQHQLETARHIEEPIWRELAALWRPDDRDFDARERHDRRDDDDIFDSTPLYALDDFAGGMFGMSVNPATRWFEFGAEDPDFARWQPAREWLYQAANVVYSSCSPAVSRFYQMSPQWIANLGAFGHGPFYQEETEPGTLMDVALPIGQVYLDRDAAGNYDTIHRKYKRKGRQVRQQFGDRVPSNLDDKRDYVCCQAIRKNPDFRLGALGPRGKPWLSTYFSPDIKDLFINGGYYELPVHIPTWDDREGSAYARGPGHNARADAQQLQEMERSHIVAAQYTAEPPLLLEEENVLSAADLQPAALLYGTMSDAGKQKAAFLEKKGQLTLSLQQSEQRRAAIRTAFHFNLMQIAMQRPQMTATEFLGLQEETLKLMAPNLVRVQVGGLSSFLTRRYRILERAGKMPPPPPEFANRRVTIEYISPLAKVQRIAEGRGVLQLQAALESMAVTDPGVRDWFNGDKAASVVSEAFTAVPDILRDDRDVRAIRQQKAQQAQQEMQLAQAERGAGVIANVSHAAQAASLSQQRGRPQ